MPSKTITLEIIGVFILFIVIFFLYTYSFPAPPPPSISTQCKLPYGFTCQNSMISSNGTLTLSIKQGFTYQIILNQVGCNTAQTSKLMSPASQPYFQGPVNMSAGSSGIFAIKCYYANSTFPSDLYRYTGYIVLNYSIANEDVHYTVYGQIKENVSK